MEECKQPRAEVIPEPLLGSELDTFAHYTVTVRMPNIARRTIQDNHFTPEVVAGLETLIAEIPYQPLRPLQDDQAPDTLEWNRALANYTGLNWLETPWFFCEMYFYRRILEAIGYFQPGPFQGLDPYLLEKQAGLEQSVGSIASISEQVEAWHDEQSTNAERLAALIQASTWGNQADLSMWTAGGQQPEHADSQRRQEHLLVDDSHHAADLIMGPKNQGQRVDLLLDNAGLELVNDLALADYLLTHNLAQVVQLHTKPFPTYVSDATETDILYTLDFLENNRHTASSSFGKRLHAALTIGRLQVATSLFWTSPNPGWNMPPDLRQDLGRAGLIISKGDAHYRRWLGDRHWAFSTPLDQVVCYAPASLLLLRTLKSEVAVGLSEDQADRLFHQDPRWLTDGLWSVIQLWRNSQD